MNLLLAERLMAKRTPDEGQPASTQTLYQNTDLSLSFLAESFQPGSLGREEEGGETHGKDAREQE